MIRVAVLHRELCKPEKCGRECIKYCPDVRIGKKTIEFTDKYPVISEILCSGCGICVKKCPFSAISIVNLPDELETQCVHCFGENMFKLYRLPVIKKGAVTGLVGQNATGKTTALKILSGKIKPNLCDLEKGASNEDIINFFRGSELQSYFQKLYREGKVSLKPQYISDIPKTFKGTVLELLKKFNERKCLDKVVEEFELGEVLDRKISVLSGGELQKVAIAVSFLRNVDIYLFDEPSSYLDVKERFNAAKKIKKLAGENKSVVVVEHDLSILDYLSDYICIFYGKPNVYGIVSNVHSSRTGLNIYLHGFIPDENIRFRREKVIFSKKSWKVEETGKKVLVEYTNLKKKLGSFGLKVNNGSFFEGEVIGVMGRNATGKTTFLKILAGLIKQDEGEVKGNIKVSYKPQYLKAESEDTVQVFLKETLGREFRSKTFHDQAIIPLNLEKLFDFKLSELSGGELQKVAVVAALFREVDVVLLDEPSAYLDSEIRLKLAKTVRKIIENSRKAAVVIDHDILFLDSISDRLIVFSGIPARRGVASSPLPLEEGMNKFLASLEITFRRDLDTNRPRINKPGSKLDRLQKKQGRYYY